MKPTKTPKNIQNSGFHLVSSSGTKSVKEIAQIRRLTCRVVGLVLTVTLVSLSYYFGTLLRRRSDPLALRTSHIFTKSWNKLYDHTFLKHSNAQYLCFNIYNFYTIV